MSPLSNHFLYLEGPIVHAEIHSNESSFLSTKNDNSEDVYRQVNLLVDTGSNISGLDYRIIESLNLKKYSLGMQVSGVGGDHTLSRYSCILFMDIFGRKGLPIDVLAGDYEGSSYDGIIGRDVLRYCRFVFDGPANECKLEAIDF